MNAEALCGQDAPCVGSLGACPATQINITLTPGGFLFGGNFLFKHQGVATALTSLMLLLAEPPTCGSTASMALSTAKATAAKLL